MTHCALQLQGLLRMMGLRLSDLFVSIPVMDAILGPVLIYPFSFYMPPLRST